MPREEFSGRTFLPRDALLSFEEIARLASVFVGLGVSKLRLTGGEPLMRSELDRLVEMLAPLGVDLALTTNGVLLGSQVARLARAGLRRVTVSLDALDEDVFQKMSDAPQHRVSDVLAGVDAALAAGLDAVKINCVVRRGINEDQVEKLVRHFRGSGSSVRFIEYMDVGSTNQWRRDEVVSGAEILARIEAISGIEAVAVQRDSEVARRYRFRDGGGEIGVITSVSQPFCGRCTRARLSADGKLYTCLFASDGFDLRALLRSSAKSTDDELSRAVTALWSARDDRYSELRELARSASRLPPLSTPPESAPLATAGETTKRHLPTLQPLASGSRVEMSYIGG